MERPLKATNEVCCGRRSNASPPLNVWTPLQNLDVPVLQKIQKGLTKPLGICLFNVRTSGNIGMSMRTACALGFSDFIICGRRSYDRRFTVGADNYINVQHWPEPVNVKIDTIKPGEYRETIEYSPELFIEKCKEWTPIFIEQGGEDIREPTWKHLERPLLVFGNESIGIPQSFIKQVKEKIPETRVLSIPQWSILRSMNVSTAAGIAMWELRRITSV
jgi:tRNA G18 (ribose-2'-O)-methylase SpoU